MLVNFLEIKEGSIQTTETHIDEAEYTFNNRVGFYKWVQSFCQPISFIANSSDICVLIFSDSLDNVLDIVNKQFNILKRYKKIILFQEEQDFICCSLDKFNVLKEELHRNLDKNGIEAVYFDFKYRSQYDLGLKRYYHLGTINYLFELNFNYLDRYEYNRTKTKYFFSGNAAERAPRFHLQKFLTENDLLHNNEVSFFIYNEKQIIEYGPNVEGYGEFDRMDGFTFKKIQFQPTQNLSEYTRLLDFDNSPNAVSEISIETLSKSYGDYVVQFSEKSFKPFFYKRPFMLFGYKENLECLRELGFKTFDFIFDERYSTTDGQQNRLNYIMDNVKQFCDKSIDENLEIINKHSDIYNYNLEVLKKFIVTNKENLRYEIISYRG